MNLTVSPVKTPVFKGAQKYKAIRNIPGIPCACCGKRVILSSELTAAFKALAKPLALMIKKGFFDSIEKHNPEAWQLLHKYAEEEPKKSLDVILDEDSQKYHSLRNAVAEHVEKKMANDPKQTKKSKEVSVLFNDILARSRASLRGSAAVIKRLTRFKPSLKYTKGETFEQLEIYSRRYPRKTLTEIINMEEIYKFHQAKDILQRAETKERMDYHFDNIKKIIKKSNPQALDKIDELKEQAIMMFETVKDDEARIPKIKELYANALEELNCEKQKWKVFDELDKLPKTFITADSFLAYAHNHNFNDANILNSLLNPSVSTFEHIVPRAKNGADKAENGIVFCSDCNLKRDNKYYPEFIQYHPQMPFNTQRQIDYVTQQILKGKLEGLFRFWPIKVAKTLSEYTGDLISPDVSKYCQKEIKKANVRREENSQNLNILKDARNTTIQQKLKLEKEIEGFEAKITEINDELKKANSAKSYNDSLVGSLTNYLYKHKKQKK